MAKYLVLYDNDTMSDVVEADNQEEADTKAYELWKEWAESQADWKAEPLTRDLAESYDHEDELDETEEVVG